MVYLTTLVFVHLLVGYLSSRNMLIFRLTNSPPRVLIRKGTVIRESLQAERIRLETVESEMRLKGEDQMEEIKEATLETNGKLSVIKKEQNKPVQKQDLKLLRQEK